MTALVDITTDLAFVAVIAATIVSFYSAQQCKLTKPYRIIIALGWLYMAFLYLAAIIGDFYLVRTGVLTRFGLITLALVFTLESVVRIRRGGEC